jgi:hypothetical protein
MSYDATTVATLNKSATIPTIEVHCDPNNQAQIDLYYYGVGAAKPAAPTSSGGSNIYTPYSWTPPAQPAALVAMQVELDVTLVRAVKPIGNAMQAWAHVFQSSQQVDDGNGVVSAPVPAAAAAPYVEKTILVTFA